MGIGYTPVYQIRKDGVDITGHFSDRCTQLRIDYDSGNDTCQFTIDDRDWIVARPQVGDTIQIFLGYVEIGMNYMGSFEVNEVALQWLPKQILIKGSSTGQRSLYKSQTTMQFEGKTLGEIMTKLAQQGGLEARIHPDVAGIDVLFRNMTTSPQQMIAELKRHYGLTAKVVNGALVAVPIDGGQSASGESLPIVVLSQEHFGSGNVIYSQRGAYSHVVAQYVDADHVTRNEKADLPPTAGVESTPFVIERKFNNQSEAQAAAKSQAGALARSLVDASFELAKGDPWIRDQQRILVQGMREGIDGSYVADMVSHTYVKDQGILSTIKGRGDSGGSDYATLYSEASPEQRARLFLAPGPGAILGTILGANPAIGGLSPFAFIP